MTPSRTDSAAEFRRTLSRNVAVPIVVGIVGALLFVAVVGYLLKVMGLVEHTDQVLTRAYALQKADLEMESAVRGFLLNGDETALAPYERAQAQVRSIQGPLRVLVSDNPPQVDRLDRIANLQARWNEYAAFVIDAKRKDRAFDASRQAATGRQLKNAVRDEFDDFISLERKLREERVSEANRNTIALVAAYALFTLVVGGLLAWRGRKELLGLSATYESVLDATQAQSDQLQVQAWLREGQSQLADRLAREQDVGAVGHAALEQLCTYLGAVVGAVYLPLDAGGLVRVATWGWPAEADVPGHGELAGDRTLIAECAKQEKQLVLDPLPEGFLRVSSGLGEASVKAALIAPVRHERRLAAVVELGFLRAVEERDGELLALSGPTLGGALESARFRRRLQETLEETQQLNEELQTQQEELRTANEELEEQSRALKESQVNLESQQAELEQTNEQLSQFAQRLADQRDELQETQAELARRAAELERASRYKSEFLANMSHELRTPLNSSLILARLLADNATGNLSGEQVQFAESIYSAGNDLLTLINDILDIAKVEAGRLEIRADDLPIASLVDGLRAMFEPLAARKGLALRVDIAPGTPATIHTDRQRVEQILRNLMANALKFTERGEVALVLRPDGDGGIAFDVRDTGIGIEASQHALIFEAFRQADGTTSRRFGGTGLGLSISRDLAQLLGGGITVASAPGEGSTFTLVLPARRSLPDASARTSSLSPPSADTDAPRVPVPAPAPAPDTAATPKPKAHAPRVPDDRESQREGRRSVLVVEDDVAFARILLDLAHELGYHCVVAPEAGEGIRLAAEMQPDAVLLDMRLPDNSGLAVLQKLKEQSATRHIPVHVISVEDLSETALQMGAVGYMVKPASREQLRDVFGRLERKLDQKVKRVLVVEDDARQQDAIRQLIGERDVEVVTVGEGSAALEALSNAVFDCMIIDLKLPDMPGQELLRRLASGEARSFPPVIVYTGRNLSRDEETELLRYSRSIIIKGARSPERLLDEVTLFLHKVESEMSAERRTLLRQARTREKLFEGRRVLVVDDDVRNIFALTSALEHKGALVEVARNGVEALQKLGRHDDVDLVLMDVMMPEMDGYEAMRQIRREPRWQKLPVIAVTAKATREDHDRALQAGANDYLAKPIDLEKLFSMMRVWMPKLERI